MLPGLSGKFGTHDGSPGAFEPCEDPPPQSETSQAVDGVGSPGIGFAALRFGELGNRSALQVGHGLAGVVLNAAAGVFGDVADADAAGFGFDDAAVADGHEDVVGPALGD